MTRSITIEVAERLFPIIAKPKRLKIALGGRGASKSIGFADAFVKCASGAEKLCCAREFQNSIDESVHSLIASRIDALNAPGFNVLANKVTHESGGEIFYRGLSRNVTSLKSMFGVDKLWIEEGQTLSEESIEVVLPTIRESGSEIWISMNRGSSKDAISRLILKPYEEHVAKHGFYEDDEILIVEINWRDNPFFPDVLEDQRVRDKRILPRARYDHIWEGAYSDTVENAIIQPEWFDACIDAHEKLGFGAVGAEVVAYDPADGGDDDHGLSYRHGVVFLDVVPREKIDVNTGCEWAVGYAVQKRVDEFIWDADGIGAGLRWQISENLKGRHTAINAFNGGAAADDPDCVYDPIDGEISKARTNKDTFFNKRAQYYWHLRDRILRTYLAVEHGKYYDPDTMISFSSQIEFLHTLRSEVCRIPKKDNGTGRIQILDKRQMKALGIDSPNLADSVMMNLSAAYDVEKLSKQAEWTPPRVVKVKRSAARYDRR